MLFTLQKQVKSSLLSKNVNPLVSGLQESQTGQLSHISQTDPYEMDMTDMTRMTEMTDLDP
jgi:hypothetical protein